MGIETLESPVGKRRTGGVKEGKGETTPSLLAWMLLQRICEDSISASRQLRSHRSKLSK